MMVIIILLPPKNSFEYGDKFWGKKKKGGEEGWERKKRKRIKEGKYENNQYITSKEMVAEAKGKDIFNQGEGD